MKFVSCISQKKPSQFRSNEFQMFYREIGLTNLTFQLEIFLEQAFLILLRIIIPQNRKLSD